MGRVRAGAGGGWHEEGVGAIFEGLQEGPDRVGAVCAHALSKCAELAAASISQFTRDVRSTEQLCLPALSAQRTRARVITAHLAAGIAHGREKGGSGGCLHPAAAAEQVRVGCRDLRAPVTQGRGGRWGRGWKGAGLSNACLPTLHPALCRAQFSRPAPTMSDRLPP